jgi:hypothetical protein
MKHYAELFNEKEYSITMKDLIKNMKCSVENWPNIEHQFGIGNFFLPKKRLG